MFSRMFSPIFSAASPTMLLLFVAQGGCNGAPRCSSPGVSPCLEYSIAQETLMYSQIAQIGPRPLAKGALMI